MPRIFLEAMMQKMMDQSLTMTPAQRKAFLREDRRRQVQNYVAGAQAKTQAAEAKRARRRERNQRILENA